MKATDVELRGCGSFSVTLGAQCAIEKEEFWLYFSATWRGQSVRFAQKVDRYMHRQWSEDNSSSNVMSEWRNYATEAREFDPTAHADRGASLSEIARRALGEASDELVEAFLGSERFVEQEQRTTTSLRRSVAAASIHTRGKRCPLDCAARSRVARHLFCRAVRGREDALARSGRGCMTQDQWRAKIIELRFAEERLRQEWLDSPHRLETFQPDDCSIKYTLAVEQRVNAECEFEELLARTS